MPRLGFLMLWLGRRTGSVEARRGAELGQTGLAPGASVRKERLGPDPELARCAGAGLRRGAALRRRWSRVRVSQEAMAWCSERAGSCGCEPRHPGAEPACWEGACAMLPGEKG